MNALDIFALQAAAWGLRLEDRQCESLLRYADLLASYDKSNVIGTRDPGRILLDHVLDSLSCFLHEPLLRAGRLADVGSGGGLPGIPISIMRTGMPTTLIESTGKKSRFLEYAVQDLTLETVGVANARVEDVGRTQVNRGAYDVVTTRAVAKLSVVAEYCVPLLKVGGSAVAMKGWLDLKEVAEGRGAARELGAEVTDVLRVPMLTEVGDKERNLVIIRKVTETPNRYPRRAGLAVKKPLGVD